jgi:eukaryotic-like serine/threonine-protein kinase
MPHPRSEQRIRLAFGPFELDVSTGELRKRQTRIRLAPQPLAILLVLTDHPGEIVSREYMRKQIWDEGTFVDFEASLNAAIAKLRRALGDSADAPRYIETVSGRGYRFIAPIQLSNADAARLGGPPNLAAVSADRHVSPPELISNRPHLRAIWPIIIAILLLTIVAAGRFYFQHRPGLTEKDTLVLADFRNTTGDPLFDGTLRQGLEVQLEQSPYLSLLSEERTRQVLRLMGRSPDAPLTADVARNVCERTGSTAIVEGSIARLGTHYVLGLRATNCRTGDLIDDRQAEAPRKEGVLRSLSQVAWEFRTKMGESRASLREHSLPLPEATTPSLEALRAYSSAWRVAFSEGPEAAVPILQHALTIDPNFASAHAFLGRVYADAGEWGLSAETTTRAYQLRDRTSDPERFFITLSYDLQVTGNLEKAQQTAELWLQTYPREIFAHGLSSGWVYQEPGKYEEALAEAMKLIRLDPDVPYGYLNLAYNYMFLNRLQDASAALRLAAERKLEISELSIVRSELAFLTGDQSAQSREFAMGQREIGSEDWICNLQATILAHSGRLREARIMSRRAIELAQQAGRPGRVAVYEAGAALREAQFGSVGEAIRHANAALNLSKARDVEYGAAVAFTLSGDLTRAQPLANDLEKRFPEDTFVHFSYLPVLHALSALRNGEAQKALDALEIATAYELGLPASTQFGFYGALYPIYVRGEAYLAKRRGAEGAKEFQKILDHRGIVLSDPIGALAHLQLGRALALTGNKASAKIAYRDFLASWKDADRGIPVLQRAKLEYAKLQ